MKYDFKPEEVVINAWSSKRQGSWRLGWPQGIQVVHLPTRTVVTCDSERSQHRNRHLAFVELQNRLRAL
jgi:protein subunit release factor A